MQSMWEKRRRKGEHTRDTRQRNEPAQLYMLSLLQLDQCARSGFQQRGPNLCVTGSGKPSITSA